MELAQILYADSTQLDILNGPRISFIAPSLSQVISNQRKWLILRKYRTSRKAIIHGLAILGREMELAQILYADST